MPAIHVKFTDANGQMCKCQMHGLQLNDLVKYLRKLGCEIRPAKGSEVLAYRPGFGVMHKIGAHGKNRQVHPCQIREMLESLEIDLGTWLKVARR